MRLVPQVALYGGVALLLQLPKNLNEGEMLVQALHPHLAMRVKRPLGLLCFYGGVHGIDAPEDPALGRCATAEHVLARCEALVGVTLRAVRARSNTPEVLEDDLAQQAEAVH